MTSAAPTPTQERALELLGQGIGPEIVSSALGVTTSYISQLISDPNFAAQVAELRYKNLAKHNERDAAYDSLEDSLLVKMKNLLPWMTKPNEVLNAIRIINSAKRRGSSAPETITAQQTVLNLVMPSVIIKQFTVNQNNQVVKAGNQELITAQSGSMQTLLTHSKSLAKQQVIDDVTTSSSSS